MGKIENVKKKQVWFQRSHVIMMLLAVYDMIAVSVSYFVALWLRFDCQYSAIEPKYLHAWLAFVPIYAVICVAVFFAFNLYRSIWKYASYSEIYRIILATGITFFVHIIGITVIFQRMPISYYVIGIMLQFALTTGARLFYRFVVLLRSTHKSANMIPVMLIGAGSAGRMILRDVNKSSLPERVVCIIDDDENKWKRSIDGIPIFGGCNDIAAAVEKYNIQKIFIAMPSASRTRLREILNICNETGCELKNLPGTFQIVNDEVTVNNLKKVSIEDLLAREPIEPDMTEVCRFLCGKTVLITGGGGSIGSELCRQVAAHQPKQLIIFDIYENNAYAIQMELQRDYPELNLVTLIGSVRDSRKIFSVMKKYKPNICIHAAAHKHVPLMEDSPCEAIKNNAIGTYKTAYAAMVNGVDRFVLISTDKAVNPTNIMGASKRLCEMVIQSFDAKIKAGRAADIPQLFTHEGIENADEDGTGDVFRKAHTEFVAVRFGNVLGSNGSVIPRFKEQIANGGPVTVTDKRIIRYFMTIPEAVRLVLLASSKAKGGEIFVLDMGEPVKIDDLARNMIKLSGLKPDVDIPIVYTGLRPGEKLYEEKLMVEEGLRKTEDNLIYIGEPIPFCVYKFLDELEGLMERAYVNAPDIRSYVEKMVSTYHDAEFVNSAVLKQQEKKAVQMA